MLSIRTRTVLYICTYTHTCMSGHVHSHMYTTSEWVHSYSSNNNTHARTHAHWLTHTHTHSDTHTHTHTHTHTYVQGQSTVHAQHLFFFFTRNGEHTHTHKHTSSMQRGGCMCTYIHVQCTWNATVVHVNYTHIIISIKSIWKGERESIELCNTMCNSCLYGSRPLQWYSLLWSGSNVHITWCYCGLCGIIACLYMWLA